MREVPETIGKLWQQGSAGLFCLSQVSHAFGILALALAKGTAPTRFWFPDYFTNGALTKLRDLGAEIFFYPVTLDMHPDWEACEAMAEEAPPDVFVLVHYFGVCNDIENTRAFCDRTGARLLEDATQVLRPIGEIGTLGDFVCYGPRKFFPIPDDLSIHTPCRNLRETVPAFPCNFDPPNRETCEDRQQLADIRLPRSASIRYDSPETAPEPIPWP